MWTAPAASCLSTRCDYHTIAWAPQHSTGIQGAPYLTMHALTSSPRAAPAQHGDSRNGSGRTAGPHCHSTQQLPAARCPSLHPHWQLQRVRAAGRKWKCFTRNCVQQRWRGCQEAKSGTLLPLLPPAARCCRCRRSGGLLREEWRGITAVPAAHRNTAGPQRRVGGGGRAVRGTAALVNCAPFISN